MIDLGCSAADQSASVLGPRQCECPGSLADRCASQANQGLRVLDVGYQANFCLRGLKKGGRTKDLHTLTRLVRKRYTGHATHEKP